MTLTAAAEQDPALFEALGQGDEGALAEIMQRHTRWVRGVVYAVLGPGPELDDVTQQVWVTAWRRGSTLEDTRRWRTWLYRIARNTAIDAGRKRKRRRSLWKAVIQQQSDDAMTDVPADAPLHAREAHDRVLRAIHGLPQIYREPFVLRHLEDWSYKQIAETMDMPVDTVETRLVRARRLLRESLADLRPKR